MGDGIPLWRHMGDFARYIPDCSCEKEPFIAYPADVARARERVVEAAVHWWRAGGVMNQQVLLDAVKEYAALDAAEGGAGVSVCDQVDCENVAVYGVALDISLERGDPVDFTMAAYHRMDRGRKRLRLCAEHTKACGVVRLAATDADGGRDA